MMTASKDTKASARIIGIERLRIGIDGKGISTLVGFSGCPLRCNYCLNPQCFDNNYGSICTPTMLYEKVKVDSLYFAASEGGVTFGGGEPLLNIGFIEEFCALCPSEWHFCIETSLNVDAESVKRAVACVDMFFVDIKDTDPEIYKRYTSKSNKRVLENLQLLLSIVPSERILVRVPLIPDYNTEKDREKSIKYLKSIGVEQIDLFEYDTEKGAKKRAR